jgi:septum site-determining protein MinC
VSADSIPVDPIQVSLYVRNVTTSETRPFIRLRGRSIMALVLAPELPLDDWLVALDTQIQRSPSFFDGRPVVVDLGLLPKDHPNIAAFIRQIEQRGIHIIGTESAHPSWVGLEAWGRPLPGAGKPGRPIEVPEEPRPAAAAVAPPAVQEPAVPQEVAALVIDQPIRSGQSVVFERGDVTILGSVASGAEVMAGGSVHIYGTLRGRAIAGLAGNNRARIFCRKLQAELLAIDGVYQTADDMPAALLGRPVQAWLDGEQMKITVLD